MDQRNLQLLTEDTDKLRRLVLVLFIVSVALAVGLFFSLFFILKGRPSPQKLSPAAIDFLSRLTPVGEGKTQGVFYDGILGARGLAAYVANGEAVTTLLPGYVAVMGPAKGGVIISGNSPSVSVRDSTSANRSILGVAELTNIDQGGTASTPESSLVFFNKKGEVLLELPAR